MIQIGQTPATIDTPIEHLMACHRRIEDRLTTLERAADLLNETPDAALAAIEASIQFLDSSGGLHTLDEELSLFPRLRLVLSQAEIEYVDSLELQHRESELIYGELKRAVRRLEESPGCDTAIYRELAGKLSRLYRDHIRSEDEILTLLARRSLGDSELRAISREMRDRRQSL